MPTADAKRIHAERTLASALEALRREGSSAHPANQFREVFERSISGIALVAPDGTILEANCRAAETLGPTPGSDPTMFIGVPLWDCAGWNSAADVRQRLRTSIAGAGRGILIHHELEVPGGDASVVTYEISFSPIADATGQVRLIVAEWRDVSDRKLAEAGLQESEERFHRIVSIAADAIISIDESQRITLFNQGAEQIFGYTAGEVVGKPLDLLLPPELTQVHRGEVRAFGDSPEVARRMGQRRQILGRRKSGEVFHAEASISKTTVGGRRMFTAVLRDVTDRWAAEQEKSELLAAAQSARELAEHAARQRDEMIEIVSHDLRNPLAAISMCAGALADESTPPDEREHLAETVRESVELTQRLISDLLDITSIEAGRLSINKRPFDPMITLARALSLFELPVARHSLRLQASGEEHLPELHGDPDRILQVLANLIGNAIKFTRAGGTISVGAESQNGAVLFSVSDTGVGIAPEHVPLVFERRWHGVDLRERGSGLGLAIARGIVEAHGGRIWVETEVGRGSTFRFTVPFGRS
jgi:PAS domain S-box-containing protein